MGNKYGKLMEKLATACNDRATPHATAEQRYFDGVASGLIQVGGVALTLQIAAIHDVEAGPLHFSAEM